MNEHIGKPIFSVVKEDTRNLDVGTKYDLTGLVNAEVKMYLRSRHGCIIFRVPLVTHDGVQCLCEIWCDERAQEPRYSPNWRQLQLTIIRGAVFKREIDSHGMKIFFFKVNTSNRKMVVN